MGRARLAARTAQLNGLKRDRVALIVFLALTAVMTNPLVLHLARAVEDTQDALLNTWIIAWVGHALITDPLNLFSANIFYPYPNALAFSETMLPQGLFALPFNLAFDNTVLGYNLVLLASFFLAAYAMYLFVFDLTRHRGAAMVAGTIFAFNPYNLGNLAQVQLLSLGWLPLAGLFLRRLLGVSNSKSKIQNPRRPGLISNFEFRICFLCALFFSLQALSSFYYAFLAGFAVALYIIWFFVGHSLTAHSNLRSLISSYYLPLLAKLAFASVIIAVLVVPFFLPYLSVQRDLGFQRKLEESEPFSASLKLYTEVSPQNVLYGSLLAPRPPIIAGCYPLDNLFPGFVALVLGLAGVMTTKNRERWFYLILLAFAFLLSLGPRLFLTPSVGTDMTMPYRWLYDAVPLLHALRAPVRFDALVMFALAVLAGWGIQNSKFKIQNRRFRHPHLSPAGTVQVISNFEFRISSVVVPLIALEYLAIPAAHITPVPTGDAIPQYVRWLAQQPPGVVLELPMIGSTPGCPLDLTTQYLSTYHWQATPDGYNGFVPPRRGEIAYEMQSLPSERAVSLLQALDVHYLVIHTPPSIPTGVLTGDLHMAEQFGSDQVYRVAPRAQDARALSPRLYLPQPAAPGQNYWAYIVVENRAARSFAIKPTDLLQIDARWSDGTRQRVTAAMPLVTSGVTTESGISIVPVRVTAPPHAGDYHLDLRVTGDGIGAWRLAGDVAVRSEEPAHEIVLPARVVLAQPLKSSYTPGDPVDILLAWVVQNKIDAYYSASVRIVDTHGDKIGNVDRQPATPTLLWTPGALLPDRFTLTLPRDLAPGEYSVQVLMYQADQGIDALLLDERYNPREAITLGTFTVKQ